MVERKKLRRGEKIGTEEAFCSLGRFFSWLEGKISPGSEFREHMAKSRIEYLKGIKSLVDNFIDKRIDTLEKRHAKKAEKKATQVKVE
jgi:hypothetical protein